MSEEQLAGDPLVEKELVKSTSSHSVQESVANDASSKRSSTVDHPPQENVEPVEGVEEEEEEQEEVENQEQPSEKQTAYLDQHELDYQEQQERRRKALEQQLLDKTKIPESYYTISKKEDLILKYVENFDRQYVQLYPGRKELLLCPANEFGVKKFVCTTIRPTQLPFKELYDYRSCAKFVSDYLTYEVLEPPHELPTVLRSPTYTLRIQSGNCFDYSVLLVSLLRGFGYDAYVVSGYATRDITIMDETRTDSDTVEIKLMNEDDDELKGLRIHAWVLVLPGKREVAEAFFIEPSTGKIFPTDNDNYLGVESVFSSCNYWVNMQVCYDGLKGIHFDLGDNSKWEFVLLDNTQPGVISKNIDALQENDNSSDDEDEEENTSEILDLPPSWVEKILVTREQFESRCPSGSKNITYKNARHEIFADYHRSDGMVSRITFFADDLKGFHGEIREKFKNRRDKLIERIRVPHLGKIQEIFDPGRPHGLKEHVMIDGETTELHFFPNARSDGLVKRVEGDNKVRFRDFAGADDIDDKGEDVICRDRANILKMTEKFDRNHELPTSEDPAKKVYITSADKVNPYTKPPKKQHLYAQLCSLLKSEQACLQATKNSERELREILQARQAEEREVTLMISVYDTIRNNTRLPNEEEKDAHKGDEEESKITNLDYLSPFLVNYPNQTNLIRDEAVSVKDACLKSLKERLIEKANIIQGRLEEVTAEYQRRQLAYSRNADSMTVEETDEYVRFCNEALFKIHILEKRLAKHKENAPEKYIELDTKLKSDLRLLPAFQNVK
ncbi:hypothetical protein HDU67_008438 [Dinochytrium kinnereticum]|nr:hypothetical protein HDU67_008438 [Dinochytrium kinnereticum]